MASGRIKGITIEIDGDSLPLQKALKKVDSSLKDTQTQLKDVNKLLKLDPSNIDLLKQRHEYLGKAVDDTREKLETQRKAMDQLKTAGDTEENQEQQRRLAREIMVTENSLKDLEKQYRNSIPSLEAFSAKTKELSEKTKVLSATAGALAGSLLANAYNSAKKADDLATLSAQTGIAVEELQKMQYASNLVDVSVSDMTGSVKKLTMQMGKGADVFDKLGVSIYDSNGEMRNATDVWYESLDALSKISNETERDTISMELFGKSASSLTGIIDDGGQAMKAYGQEAEDLGLVLSGDAVNSAVEFNNQMDLMKERVSMAFFEMGASLADTLVPALTTLVEKVTEVVQWFSDLDGTTQTVILVILGLISAISPVAGLISSITTVVTALTGAISLLSAPVLLAVGFFGALVVAGVALYQNWETITQIASETATYVTEHFSALWNNLTGIFNSIVESGTTMITNFANGIMSGIEYVTSSIQSIMDGVMSTISGFFTDIYNAGSDIITELGDGIGNSVTSIYESVKSIGSNIVSGVWQGIQDAKDAFFSNISGFFSGLVDSAKATLGIHSPSTVFAEIGKNSALGYVEGMENILKDYNPAISMIGSAPTASYQYTNNITLNGQYQERDGYNIALSVDRWLGARI